MSLLSFAKKISPAPKKKAPAKKAASKKKTEDQVVAEETKQPVIMVMQAGIIGLVPLVTEKSVAAHADANTVMFRVIHDATKGQIAAAVLERYKVRPVKVRTMKMNPKIRRRGQTEGKTNRWKKAYVQLPKGAQIDFTS